MTRCKVCNEKAPSNFAGTFLCKCVRGSRPLKPITIQQPSVKTTEGKTCSRLVISPDISKLPIVSAERYRECLKCEHYRKSDYEYCDILRQADKPGWLWHKKGIPRHVTSCPLSKWTSQLMYEVPPENVPEPTCDKLVVTLATGSFADILEKTRPTFQAYAKRIGADYREITDKKYDVWQHEKFRVHQYVKAYDRTLFIDADCVIRDNCPDLFKLVPPTHVGIHDDYPYNVIQKRPFDWLSGQRQTTASSQGVKIDDPQVCLNSGVVVCSMHHDIWKPPPYQLPAEDHCSEQIWVEHQLLTAKYPIFYLPLDLNHQWWFGDIYKQELPHAKIVHFSGHRNKLEAWKELNGEVPSA